MIVVNVRGRIRQSVRADPEHLALKQLMPAHRRGSEPSSQRRGEHKCGRIAFISKTKYNCAEQCGSWGSRHFVWMNEWIEEEGWNTSISPCLPIHPPPMWISVCFRSAIPGPLGPSPWTQRQIPSITKARTGHHMASGCIGKEPVHFAAPALHMLQAKQCRWCANRVCFWTCVCVMCICLASVTRLPKRQSVRIELQDRVIPVCDVMCVFVFWCMAALMGTKGD